MKRRAQRRLGERIRERRSERGFTQEDLAARANVSAVYLSRVEQGNTDVGLDVMVRIAAALDVPIASLISEPGGEPVELSRKALTFAREFDRASPKFKAAILVLLNDLARGRTRGRS